MIRVAVTGLGAVTGFGTGAAPLWNALASGKRAVEVRPQWLAAGLDVGPVALVPGLKWGAPDRAVSIAETAAREAFDQAGALGHDARVGVVCGTTLGGIDSWLRALAADAPSLAARHVWAAPAQAVASALGASGPVLTTSVACASSNAALGVALDLLRDADCQAVVAGGVDVLNPFVLSGFAALKALDPAPCRPFDPARRGLNLGEGAGFLLLERESDARARGARILAFLDGHGASADAVHMTGPARDGSGCARAIERALADARAQPSEVDFVSAHGTATLWNDRMEATALARVFEGRTAHLPVNSIKSALGHTLGAAGALEAILCVRALEHGLIPPTLGCQEPDPELGLDVVRGQARAARLSTVVSTSSGFGGVNAAIVLRGP